MSFKPANVHKKVSPNGEITLYLGKRDYIDRYTAVDPIDGAVIVPPGATFGRQLFVQVLVHFRYAAESEEFANVSFKKLACIASITLEPSEKPVLSNPNISCWQASLLKKLGNIPGICTFSLPLPMGAPPSLVVQGSDGVYGEPCGLTYEVLSFLAPNVTDIPETRSSVRLNVRVVQAPPPAPSAVLRGLWEAPTAPPATMVSRQFLLSPGRMQIELCLDKPAYHSGEKLLMNLVITNSTNKTVRRIKCKLIQGSELSFAPGERRVPIYTVETQEGCPIVPGASLQRTYTMYPSFETTRHREGVVLEAPLHGAPSRLAASTVFPNSDPRESFAILVSYVAKIKLYMGTVHGDVAAEVPFLLIHADKGYGMSKSNPVTPEVINNQDPPTFPAAVLRSRMVRLISLDQDCVTESSTDTPIVAWQN